MKSLMAMTALLITIAACDRPLIRPKGSDIQWQQKQEQMEREKHQDINHSDEDRQQEEQAREVNVDHQSTIDPIKLNPANN
jgi:predicted small lipoprotein YifL